MIFMFSVNAHIFPHSAFAFIFRGQQKTKKKLICKVATICLLETENTLQIQLFGLRNDWKSLIQSLNELLSFQFTQTKLTHWVI